MSKMQKDLFCPGPPTFVRLYPCFRTRTFTYTHPLFLSPVLSLPSFLPSYLYVYQKGYSCFSVSIAEFSSIKVWNHQEGLLVVIVKDNLAWLTEKTKPFSPRNLAICPVYIRCNMYKEPWLSSLRIEISRYHLPRSWYCVGSNIPPQCRTDIGHIILMHA